MNRIVGGMHRRRSTAAVARIPAANISQKIVIHNALAARLMFEKAPFRPRFIGSGNEYFHVRLGTDDRANVASIENGTLILPRERPLILEQRRTHLWNFRNDRSGIAGAWTAERGIIQRLGVDRFRGRRRSLNILQIRACRENVSSDGPIEKSGIEPSHTEMGGDTLCKRAFA